MMTDTSRRDTRRTGLEKNAMPTLSLFDEPFLRAQWEAEFLAFRDSPEAGALLARLRAWAGRQPLNERASETAFIQRFFVETWGYRLQGHAPDGKPYTCRPQFEVPGAGQAGGTGFADLALGRFGEGGDTVAQVLCEFKDIRSGLDARQFRKQNDRSPVNQCFDYLQSAWQNRDRDALIEPSFALVTDMNEFRLYIRRLGRTQCQRFVIAGSDAAADPDLVSDHPAAAFRRFVFWRLLRPDLLLSERGPAPLDRLLREQVTREKAIEKTFYREYHDYRQFVYSALVEANPGFPGTRGRLVRLTQRFLDRCIFILFCEDMGRVLRYPPELLRDLLAEESQSRFYNPEGSGPWDAMRALFRAMREGGSFGPHAIDRFNGGLFEDDPELDALRIPAKVFCAPGQATAILDHPRTLLYFSGAYNFGLTADAGNRAISLYTLGRIFEQSITELEIMEAEADGRLSLNRLTKRKCDGVYYTPEWVVRTLVDNALGARLDAIRAETGLAVLQPLDAAALAEYRAFKKDRRRTARAAGARLEALRAYRARLDRLRIVDPACGSGAFLIQALNRLVDEYRWVVAEQERIEGERGLFDQDEIIRSILSHNIYGVDINAESVEIAKLALWLHTAAPGKPLCSLDHNIRCGNSLVGSDFAAFYHRKHETLFEQADESERERINAFDWQTAFSEVFSHGGFDCVIGNPPYIKLQHFRRAQADVADYLLEADGPDGRPLYESTRSGNFDMYLPFIEKGIRLLRPEGRMGYIAPNVWMVNEYGRSLRRLVRRTRSLDRWLDFKSHQIFDEAITYTALQFFSGAPSDAITCAFAPDGNASAVDWPTADRIPYDELPEEEAWVFASSIERALLAKLKQKGIPLGDKAVTRAIFQGMVTSANAVYHFYKCNNGYEVHSTDEPQYDSQIEDTFLRPLVTGPDAKRYLVPKPSVFLLFPYQIVGIRSELIPIDQIAANAPQTLAHLRRYEHLLRHREHPKMDDDAKWWGYVYPKNQIEQARPKIMIASTATEIRAFADINGEFTPDDRRVYSVTPTNELDLFYLLGVLNSPPATFLIRRTARPKSGGFFDIETQFIAPLPIPDAAPEARAEVGRLAQELQELHTRRRDWVEKFENRLHSPQTVPLSPAPGPEWLWADVGTVASWKRSAEVPAGLSARDLTAWAKARHVEALQSRHDALDALLQPGVSFEVAANDGELALRIGGREAVRLYDRPDTPFIAAQWRHALRDQRVTEAFDAKRLQRLLLDLRTTADAPLRDRLLALDAEIAALDATIAERESALHSLIYSLYGLTPEEITMVEGG
jgi:hypothetical protein